MDTLTLVLWLAVAVLISAIFDRIIPRVSLPLIQVVLGVVIAIGAGNAIDVNLDPDLFLVLFIAPLLYIEAKDADKAQLWKYKGSILSLAIGLVIVTTLIIGFSVNAFIPSIPLAAAFALGAALGPTDAVAVTSLSKQVSIPGRQWGMLKGELLLNDASGIVSFQFALAAVTTGVFSIFSASYAFLYEFIGGLLFGLLLGYAANFVLRRFRDLGIDSTTFHVLFEICIPFIVYLSATAVHVSGIIAVVVAGLVNVISPRTISPSVARMNIVSNSVWQVISFTLNGIVFVLLGTQIPTSMYYTWLNPDIQNYTLIIYILFITATLMGVRFIWCLCMEWLHRRRVGDKYAGSIVRNAAITTLCGSKGTITLSILFTIPFFIATGEAFPERSLIIFLGCGVILCTLLIANFAVPLVCPKKKRGKSEMEARQNYFETLADILRNVIEELTLQQTPSNAQATAQVIWIYQDRLENTKEEIDVDDEGDNGLRMQALRWEQEYTLQLMADGKVDKDIGLEFLGRLERAEKILHHREHRTWYRRITGYLILKWNQLRMIVSRLWTARGRTNILMTHHNEMMRELQLEVVRHVIALLHGEVIGDDVQTEEASRLLLMYEQRATRLAGNNPSVSTAFQIADESEDIRRLGYQIELEQIQEMYHEGRIDRQEAARMRDNVHMMQMDLNDRF